MTGVIRTRVGYCGGTTKEPTYENIGDHAETIQIDFDPEVISYGELLEVFWNTHNPCATPWSRQYMSAVFYGNQSQQETIALSLKAQEAKLGREIKTEVLPLGEFTLAEDYHQKFYLQENRTLKKEFRGRFPQVKDFIQSTAAARVNGYLGSHGTKSVFDREVDDLQLSPEALDEVKRHTRHLGGEASPREANGSPLIDRLRNAFGR